MPKYCGAAAMLLVAKVGLRLLPLLCDSLSEQHRTSSAMDP